MNANSLQIVDSVIMPQLDRNGNLINGKDVTRSVTKVLSGALTSTLDKKLPKMQGNGKADVISGAAQAVERIGSAIADKDNREGLGKDLGDITGKVAGGAIGFAAGAALGGLFAAPFAVIGTYLGGKAGKYIGDGIHSDFAKGAPVTKALAKRGMLGPGMVISVWAVEGIQAIMKKADVQPRQTVEMAV